MSVIVRCVIVSCNRRDEREREREREKERERNNSRENIHIMKRCSREKELESWSLFIAIATLGGGSDGMMLLLKREKERKKRRREKRRQIYLISLREKIRSR